MQHIQTNSKFGDLETTIFRQFCQGQRLRALFNGRSLPPLVQDFVDSLSVQESSTIRATFMQDNLAFEDQYTATPLFGKRNIKALPDDVYRLLLQYITSHDTLATYVPNKVRVHPGVQRLGKSFQSRTPGDSYILFKDGPVQSAGRIRTLFTHQRRNHAGQTITQTFLHVDKFRSLSSAHEKHDPFRSFPSGGYLCYDDVEGEQLITLEAVVSHFAKTDIHTMQDIGTKCIHVLPLDS